MTLTIVINLATIAFLLAALVALVYIRRASRRQYEAFQKMEQLCKEALTEIEEMRQIIGGPTDPEERARWHKQMSDEIAQLQARIPRTPPTIQ